MSVSAISSNPQVYQPNAQQQSQRQDLQSLTTALQSGDLTSAQQAYSTLVQDNPQLASSSSSGSGNPFQQAIASIGSSLQSGDISGAQNALSSLQQTIKAHHGGHHHHGGGGTQSATSTSAAANPLTATSTSINFLT